MSYFGTFFPYKCRRRSYRIVNCFVQKLRDLSVHVTVVLFENKDKKRLSNVYFGDFIGLFLLNIYLTCGPCLKSVNKTTSSKKESTPTNPSRKQHRKQRMFSLFRNHTIPFLLKLTSVITRVTPD